MFDYEAVLPFTILALLLWPARLVRSVRGVVIVGLIVISIGQCMILTRTFSRERGKLQYFIANETLLFMSVFAVLGAQHVSADN